MLKIGRYKHGGSLSLANYLLGLGPDVYFANNGNDANDVAVDKTDRFDLTINGSTSVPGGGVTDMYDGGAFWFDVENIIDFTSAFTLSFWFRSANTVNSLVGGHTFVSAWGDDSNGASLADNWILRIPSTNNDSMEFLTKNSSGTTTSYTDTPEYASNRLYDGSWHRVLIYNDPFNIMEVVIDNDTFVDDTGFAINQESGRHVIFFAGYAGYTGTDPGGPVFGSSLNGLSIANMFIKQSATSALVTSLKEQYDLYK